MAKWKRTSSDLATVLSDQNPWTTLGTVPDELAPPVERALGKDLWRRLISDQPHRYEIILGPRRVGKTTVMYQTVRHLLESGVPPERLWWFRLDHPILLDIPLGTLISTMCKIRHVSDDAPAYVFFDELVYAESWDLWLKTFYDERRPIKVVATSSATAALRDRQLESGVGRWEEQYLMPYLYTEFLDLAGAGSNLPIGPTLDQTILDLMNSSIGPAALQKISSFRDTFVFTGGFPELLLNSVPSSPERDVVSRILHSQRILRTDAVERAIYKDIPQTFQVDNPMMLERVLYVLAGQATGLLSPSKICSELGSLSQPTFERYLSYLERAFLVFTLPNYSGREITVQKRGRKLYFVDGAIRNAALHRGIAPLSSQAEMGVLLENLAASTLYALATQSQVRLFHWRDGSDEVDLIYAHPEHPMAFEIASSADHPRTGLINLANRHKRFRGRCYLVSPDAQTLKPESTASGVGTMPLDLFLVAVGRQAELALQMRLAQTSALPNETSTEPLLPFGQSQRVSSD